MTISRREFLLHSGVLTGATLVAGRRAWAVEDTADVIVVGAGLSGLQAAWAPGAERLQGARAGRSGPRGRSYPHVRQRPGRPRGGRQHHLRRLPAVDGGRDARRRAARGPGAAAVEACEVHARARRQAGEPVGMGGLAPQSVPARAARNDAVAIRAAGDEPGKSAHHDRRLVRGEERAVRRVDARLPAPAGRNRSDDRTRLRHDSDLRPERQGHLCADDGVRVGIHRGAEIGQAGDAAGQGWQPEPPARDGRAVAAAGASQADRQDRRDDGRGRLRPHGRRRSLLRARRRVCRAVHDAATHRPAAGPRRHAGSAP